MKMLKAFFVFFVSGLDVKRFISYHEFFFYHLLVCGQRFDRSPAQCFHYGALRRHCGKGFILFLSQTIIMQLVFECSFDTNVYHFKLVFLDFFTVY